MWADDKAADSDPREDCASAQFPCDHEEEAGAPEETTAVHTFSTTDIKHGTTEFLIDEVKTEEPDSASGANTNFLESDPSRSAACVEEKAHVNSVGTWSSTGEVDEGVSNLAGGLDPARFQSYADVANMVNARLDEIQKHQRAHIQDMKLAFLTQLHVLRQDVFYLLRPSPLNQFTTAHVYTVPSHVKQSSVSTQCDNAESKSKRRRICVQGTQTQRSVEKSFGTQGTQTERRSDENTLDMQGTQTDRQSVHAQGIQTDRESVKNTETQVTQTDRHSVEKRSVSAQCDACDPTSLKQASGYLSRDLSAFTTVSRRSFGAQWNGLSPLIRRNSLSPAVRQSFRIGTDSEVSCSSAVRWSRRSLGRSSTSGVHRSKTMDSDHALSGWYATSCADRCVDSISDSLHRADEVEDNGSAVIEVSYQESGGSKGQRRTDSEEVPSASRTPGVERERWNTYPAYREVQPESIARRSSWHGEILHGEARSFLNPFGGAPFQQ